jgi:hypothetical protein
VFRWCLLVYVVGSGSSAWAHDVISTKLTWSREVARIVYRRCVSCHQDGGSAFSLVKYDEARPWAKAIKEEVLGRRMPPWNAVKGFGELKDDQGLTQEQIEIIAQWVEGGAPEGDPLLLPSKKDLQREQKRPLKITGTVQVAGAFTLPQSAEFSGIIPGKLNAGASVQVTAVFPDGSVEPLLWVKNFNPAYDRSYYFARPLRLPAGSRIQVFPASAASITLFRVATRASVPE